MRYSIAFFLLLPGWAFAQLQTDRIFSSNMVLQRNKPIHIWGRAVPGNTVVVSFSGHTKKAVVNADSSWTVFLPGQKANPVPQDLRIVSGKEQLTLRNLLIGDVWICIGQSNMEWPMIREMHYKEAVVTSNQPLLRFYNPTYAGKNTFNTFFSDSVLKDLSVERFFKGQWEVSDSNSFRTMSAVAYYYGRAIIEATQLPIGLMNLSIAGAPLETFIDIKAIRNSPQFSEKAREPWLTNAAIPTWVKERGNQNLRTGTNHPFKPGFVYAAGIEPIAGLAIKGIINYQGESNAQEPDRVNEYAALSGLMVKDYRTLFKNPAMPYYFVQLSSIDTLKYKGHFWHLFRNEERKILDLVPNSGMAVSTDHGLKDNVHPVNKKIVGERLARWALNRDYGQNIVPSGPLPTKAVYINERILIHFKYKGKGLNTSDKQLLRGFSLDGIQHCDASIEAGGVLIKTAAKPAYIYYNWKPYTEGNLMNSEKLPASTFKIKVE